MSQDIALPNSNLKEYLSEFKNMSEKDLRLLFNWNKKFQILWHDINFEDWIEKDLSQSSYGEIKRLKFLKAYCSNFNWIALDEPTSGLDSEKVNSIIKAINDLSKKTIVLICTHEEKLISNSSLSIELRKV